MLNNFVLKDFGKAIARLEEVLALEKTKIIRDSAIKRFELCFDLSWKTIKIQAKKSGMECYSPKDCFKTAFQLKLIDYGDKWLEIIDDRNSAVHIYKEEYADKIYSKLPEYLKMFKGLLKKLKKVN